MIDSVITLIKKSYTRNSDGALEETESSRDVFCEVSSIGRNEFYSAAQAGLDVQLVFRTNPVNYEEEDTLEYDGQRYSITRTYKASLDTLEIYAGYAAGENRTAPDPEVIDNGSNSSGE